MVRHNPYAEQARRAMEWTADEAEVRARLAALPDVGDTEDPADFDPLSPTEAKVLRSIDKTVRRERRWLERCLERIETARQDEGREAARQAAMTAEEQAADIVGRIHRSQGNRRS